MKASRIRLAVLVLLGGALSLALVISACGDDSEEAEQAGAPAGNGVLPAVSQRGSGVSAADFRFVTGTGLYAVPELAMPAKGQTFNDPDFNTPITRVTDVAADGIEDPGISNEYARSDPENSDGSMLILRGNWGTWYLYDARTLEMLERLPDDMLDAPEFEPRWDAADPDVFYYLYQTELRAFDTESRESTTIHEFAGDVPGAAYITTGSEGDASLDRRYWGFMAEDEDGETLAVVTYDRENDKVMGRFEDLDGGIDYVSMDMTGSHCIIGWDERSMEVFSPDFSSSVDLPEGVTGHSDFALTGNGTNVLVYQNTATDWIAWRTWKAAGRRIFCGYPSRSTPTSACIFPAITRRRPAGCCCRPTARRSRRRTRSAPGWTSSSSCLSSGRTAASGASPTPTATRRSTTTPRRTTSPRPSPPSTPRAPAYTSPPTGRT